MFEKYLLEFCKIFRVISQGSLNDLYMFAQILEN